MKTSHPLKVLRYCPKCGSSRFKAACERSLKCGDCGFILFINSAAAVAALICDNSNRLLLTVRGIEPGYGKLDLPGGFINPGESAESAVKRELFEELGLEVKSVNYFGSAPNEYIYNGFSIFTLDMAFNVVPHDITNLKAMDDITDFKFISEKDIDYSQIPAPSIKSFVQQFFNR
jgi:NADH pyrophosphatase NudC (nudix superfamily)